MKILLTGAAGFIGSYTVRELVRLGHDVVGIDNYDEFYSRKAKEFAVDLTNLFSGNELNYFSEHEVTPILDLLKTFHMKHLDRVGEGRYSSVDLDILEYERVTELFDNEDFDAVIHLAAMAGVPHSLKDPLKYSEVNISGTTHLLNEMVKHEVKNLVFASSSSVYGNCTDTPFREDLDVDKPISPYAATKRMGEILNYTFHKLYDLNVMNLRFFTVYGPLQRPYGMAIQKFIKQTFHGNPMTVYGDGSMARDFTYIDDIVDGIVAALERNKGYSTFNLGNKMPTSLTDLTNEIRSQMGKGSVTHLDKPPTEVSITCADISNAQNVLGYVPQVSIQEGIRRQIEVFKAMPKWFQNLSE
ncbi:NAD-dependent epimerase/dehydratase family protein [Candidatus Dojkabacteria bacterium]|uniref:NAD-dependent epimerase/dehydratase family protein n=1 Tax=Candidatus Dojkabacteria bacterium TaxID=2099670 RepID=A0A955L816_9BACT|nr:NAD-dependent epimerase/dehydratase family protein [Candidatus Dojkabacteria bacterium]